MTNPDLYTQALEISKRFTKENITREFYKGQILFLQCYDNWNVAVKILRVNKNTLTVYRIGMQGKRLENSTARTYARKDERIDKIVKDTLIQHWEISLHEAALMLYAAKLHSRTK